MDLILKALFKCMFHKRTYTLRVGDWVAFGVNIKKKTFVRGTDEFNHDSALRSYEMYMQHGIRVHIRDYIVMLQGRYG
jgi:hypothetical protein